MDTSINVKPLPEIRQRWLSQKKQKTRANCSLKVCEIESCSWNNGKDGSLWDEEAKGGWRADRGSEGDGVERWKEKKLVEEKKKEEILAGGRTGGNQRQQNAQIVDIY